MPVPVPDPVAEVQVIAPHRDVGETTVRRDDTKDLPGTFGDPTRFVESLPGVVPSSSGLQAFFVRGAPPTATGYFVDGVPVPALYHVGFGPSVVHPALLDHVDFYQGAPPAGYGRYVGGVLAATTAAPQARAHGEANLRLFDAGAYEEAAFADGRASALAAARYGYPGTVLPLFAPDTGLTYWDYQARATWRPDDGGRDRLTAFVFGSYDRLTQKQTDVDGAAYWHQLVADEFHRVDLRWDRALGAQSALRVAATLGRDVVGDDVSNAIDDVARLRAELDTRPGRAVRVRAGADVQVDQLRPGSPPEGSPAGSAPIAVSRNAVVVGAHADVAWRVAPGIELLPGVRADVYATDLFAAQGVPVAPGAVGGSASPAVDPRFAARVRVLPWLTSVSTFGVSHQLPGIVAQYPQTTPYLQPGVTTGLQSSVQTSQGLEVALPASLSLAATGFLHDYAGLPDVTACAFSQLEPSRCVTPTVSGRAYGLELLLRRPFTERFTVWIAYTVSRSTRQAHTPVAGFGPSLVQEIPSEYDRTHVVSAIVSYDLGKGWHIGGRVFGYTGRPYTAFTGSSPVLPYDSERLPGFFRIDARVEKAWTLGAHARLAVVLEGINLTLNKETVSATCGGPSGTSGAGVTGASGAAGAAGVARNAGGPAASIPALNACTFDTIGPITIPSIGAELAW